MDDFIKDISLIEERISDTDLLDFSSQIDSFSKKLDEFQSSGLIGLVGAFGKGKSTLIRQVEKSRGDEEHEKNWRENLTKGLIQFSNDLSYHLF